MEAEVTFHELRKKIKGIVPLHPKNAPKGYLTAASAAVPPHLTYRNGPLLSSVEVSTIFWGKKWQTDPTAANTRFHMDSFMDYLVISPYMTQLQEYNVPAFSIKNGKHVSSTVYTASSPTPLTLDLQIRRFLRNRISSGVVPQPNANSLYFIYMPPGVAVQKSIGISCVTFCGYHDHINNQIFYAVIPYASCTGCQGGLGFLEAMTTISSHEFAEAITDPIPGSGWYDDNNGEVGDICPFQTKTIATFTVQKEWSNIQNACV